MSAHTFTVAAALIPYVAAMAGTLYLGLTPTAWGRLRRAARAAGRLPARAYQAPARYRHGTTYHRTGKARHAKPAEPRRPLIHHARKAAA